MGVFDRENDMRLQIVSKKWDKVKEALASFRGMQGFREDFRAENYDSEADEPIDMSWSLYDAAMTDYKEELAYLGALLTDAVAEALGVKE
jgi:hypothetical protein